MNHVIYILSIGQIELFKCMQQMIDVKLNY